MADNVSTPDAADEGAEIEELNARQLTARINKAKNPHGPRLQQLVDELTSDFSRVAHLARIGAHERRISLATLWFSAEPNKRSSHWPIS